MFLIAGVQPRIKKLEDTARRCPSCGQFQAYRKRVDHYLSVFFIPLLKVKTGTPYIVCDRCSHTGSENGRDHPSDAAPRQTQCSNCGRQLQREFSFCPYCGVGR